MTVCRGGAEDGASLSGTVRMRKAGGGFKSHDGGLSYGRPVVIAVGA